MMMKKQILHLLIPRPSNNYKAKIWHLGSLFSLVVFLLGLQVFFALLVRTRAGVLGFASDIDVNSIVTLTNQKRREAGLPDLSLNSALSSAAQMKADDMFGANYWAHTSPSGKTPWQFIKSAGYRYLYAGENLARDFATSRGVVDAWMASPAHRENILSTNYKEIGVAIVNGVLLGHETTLVVQMFGSPATLGRGIASAQTKQKGEIVKPAAKSAKPIIPQAPSSPSLVVKDNKKESEVLTYSGSYNFGSKPMTLRSASSGRLVDKKRFNPFALSREVALLLTAVLVFVLGMDAVIVARHKIVRIAGHNIVHASYLAIVAIALLLSTQGVIL